MSRLLQSGRTAPLAVWAKELDIWRGKLADLEKSLEAKKAEATDPTKDPWFGEIMKPDIDLIEHNTTVARRTVAALAERHAAAKKAQPAALQEQADAYKERDALAAEIADRFPTLVGELADLLSRAAASEDRLRKVAVVGEGKIDSTSPWSRARGESSPLVVKGGNAAPTVVLHDLKGEVVWSGEAPADLSPGDIPHLVNVRNLTGKPLQGHLPDGNVIAIDPGAMLANAPGGVFASMQGVEIAIP